MIDSCAKLGLCEAATSACGGLRAPFLSLAAITAAANCCCAASPIFGKFLRIIASCCPWAVRVGLWRRCRRGIVWYRGNDLSSSAGERSTAALSASSQSKNVSSVPQLSRNCSV